MEIPIYIINYKNEERKNRILERFKKLDLNVKFLEPLSNDDPRILQANFDKRVCHITLQHLNCIQDFLSNTNSNYCIVGEDDINISKYFKEDLPFIIENFDRLKLDILMLGYLLSFKILNNDYFPLVEKSYGFFKYPDDTWGTQMYLISRKYGEFLINKYTVDYANEHLNEPYAADWTITKNGNRALICPMIAVEEGQMVDNDQSQNNFHKKCFEVNYNKDLYY